MADKRISQLIERTDIANNDVLPIVASGATTTNKVTISTIQDWMQDNLDVGVTSVGITLGTSGTDVNVSGSPITTSGNITINIPDASTSARGVVTTGTQTFAGNKSFQNTIFVNAGLRLDQNGTALPTFVQNISGTGLISSGSNGLGFNSANNLYFSGSEKGGAVLAVNNSAVRTYTLQDANGTLAFTSDLTGYVTLGTAQTITAQKTFSTSGGSDTAIINHGSGSGIALNITKGGNGEGLRVTKTSGSGNAVTITGGTLSAEAGQFSGDLQTSTRISATSGANGITITPNVGGTQNRIETTGTLPLSLVSAAAITMAAGGTTPQITLATTGAATFSSSVTATQFITGGTPSNTAGFTNSFYAEGNIPSLTLSNTGTNTGKYTLGVTNGNFGIWNNPTSSYRLFIDSSGNVGIGTASPSQRLHVANSAGSVVAFLQSTATNGEPSLNLEGRNSSGTVRSASFKYDNADILRLGTSSAIDFRFETSDTERMRITSGGLVQVGASTTARLGVRGFTNDSTGFALEAANASGNSLFLVRNDGNVSIGYNSPNKFGVLEESAKPIRNYLGNFNSQGRAQNYKIVRHLPVVSTGNVLIIPFISQGSLNSNTIARVMGHSARFNTAQPLGFIVEFAVGHLQTLSSLSVFTSHGVSAVSINGMNIEISFGSTFQGSVSNGMYLTIEYMTNEVGYSIDVTNLRLN